ncbi:hypothetical protein P8C59_001160 [Phyllachora maydis]|uniref:Elongator complex protein 6 n=1 Tax=Phyllachora maydis TaxID=1825666 RepID=A0AAD9HXV5_9PEZI|nr:hypothetical protein P8C59_001160 [Phyllachora maydis]
MTSRIAPLLEPYLTLPEDASLVVLTGILGASTNWLVLRYLSSYLLPPSSPPPPPRPTAPPTEADPAPPAAVLLVSFLRDLPFWRDGASRLGLDLEAAGRQGRFAFVDGLRGLFPGAVAAAPGAAAAWQSALAGASLAHVGRVLHEAADRLREGDGDAARTRAVVLVVDQLDFLLAAAGGAEEEGVGDVSALRVRELLMGLREKVHATVLTLSADEPLIAAQATPLEQEHANLVLGLAHEAELVLSLRLLDTGTAKDVSGVVRITRGGQWSTRKMDEREYLYHAGGDGGVRVFVRGQ